MKDTQKGNTKINNCEHLNKMIPYNILKLLKLKKNLFICLTYNKDLQNNLIICVKYLVKNKINYLKVNKK